MAMGWKRLVARKSYCQKPLQDRKGYRPERATGQKGLQPRKGLQARKGYRPVRATAEREKGL